MRNKQCPEQAGPVATLQGQPVSSLCLLTSLDNSSHCCLSCTLVTLLDTRSFSYCHPVIFLFGEHFMVHRNLGLSYGEPCQQWSLLPDQTRCVSHDVQAGYALQQRAPKSPRIKRPGWFLPPSQCRSAAVHSAVPFRPQTDGDCPSVQTLSVSITEQSAITLTSPHTCSQTF